jgi:hypothetical protein
MSGSGASAVCEVEGGVNLSERGGREGGAPEGPGAVIEAPVHSDVMDLVQEIIASAATTGTLTSSTSTPRLYRDSEYKLKCCSLLAGTACKSLVIYTY